jgi:hypothetical protein
MFAGSPGRNHRALGLRGNEFSLPGQNRFRGRKGDDGTNYLPGELGGLRPPDGSRHGPFRGIDEEDFNWGQHRGAQAWRFRYDDGASDGSGSRDEEIDWTRYRGAQVPRLYSPGQSGFGGLGGLHRRDDSSHGPHNHYPARRPYSTRSIPSDLPDYSSVFSSRQRPSSVFGRGLRRREQFRLAPQYASDIGSGSSTDSPGSVSQYSPHRMDRFPHPHHYQSPYVEDYESEIAMEILRQKERDELRGINTSGWSV